MPLGSGHGPLGDLQDIGAIPRRRAMASPYDRPGTPFNSR